MFALFIASKRPTHPTGEEGGPGPAAREKNEIDGEQALIQLRIVRATISLARRRSRLHHRYRRFCCSVVVHLLLPGKVFPVCWPRVQRELGPLSGMVRSRTWNDARYSSAEHFRCVAQ